jgi:hypothetical protein
VASARAIVRPACVVASSLLMVAGAGGGAGMAETRRVEDTRRIAVDTVRLADPSRPYAAADEAAGPRPFLVTVWRPAETGPAEPLRLGDYVDLTLAEMRLDGRQGAAMALVWGDRAAAAPAAAQAAARQIALRGRRGARAGDPRPLVMAVHGTPASFSVLAEALADAGFAVAAFQSKDAGRGPYRLSVENLQAMADDIAFVRRALQTGGMARPGAYAVVGASNGALGAVAAALAGEPVAGIVGLDGTVTERAASRAVPQLRGAGPLPPLLQFYTPDNPYLDLAWIRAYPHDDCTLSVIDGFDHQDFLAPGWLRADAPQVFGPPAGHRALADRLLRDTTTFLRRVLLGGVDAPAAPRPSVRPCRAP